MSHSCHITERWKVTPQWFFLKKKKGKIPTYICLRRLNSLIKSFWEILKITYLDDIRSGHELFSSILRGNNIYKLLSSTFLSPHYFRASVPRTTYK